MLLLTTASHLRKQVPAYLRDGMLKEAALHSFHKKDVLLEPGKYCRHVYYIEEGYLRSFFENETTDTTLNFFGPGELVTSFHAQLLKSPSMTGFQWVTVGKARMVPLEEMVKASKTVAEVQQWSFQMMQYALAEEQLKHIVFRSFTAEQRYKQFLAELSHLLEKIPLHYIASFLNMKTETLIRIRRKMQQTALFP
jgi:hypothetical protein